MSSKIVYIGDRLPAKVEEEKALPVVWEDDDRYLFPGVRRTWLVAVDFWEEYSWVFEDAFWAVADKGADIYYGATTSLLISYDKAKINGIPMAKKLGGFARRKVEDIGKRIADAWKWRSDLYRD